MHTAWTRLAEAGYRRIGLVMNHSTDLNSNGQWVAAYLWRQIQAGPEHARPAIGNFEIKDVAAFQAWFETEKPDAIISRKSLNYFLETVNLQPGHDIGYVRLGVPDEDLTTTGTKRNAHEIGTAAVDLLDGCLEKNDIGIPKTPRLVLIPNFWQDGLTIRD